MNILYIMTDQQRLDTVSCYGRGPCRTPHLDRLAAEGVRFDTAYTVCTLCTPARASMLTGLYPHKHGLRTNNDMNDCVRREFPDDVRLISRDLVEAGFNCGYVGKWHCGHDRVPGTYGFEGMDVPDYGSWQATSEYTAYLEREGLERPKMAPEGKGLRTYQGDPAASEPRFLAAEAADLLRKYSETLESDGSPFLLFLSFWGPHMPYDVPEPYASMYDPDDVDLGPGWEDSLQGKPAVHRRFREKLSRSDRTAGDWKRAIARYRGYCSQLDDAIGGLLDLLGELGREEDTAVLFSTDHGNMIGAHGGFSDKGPFAYEETYHIPLIARLPDGAAGGVCIRPVTNMDLASTTLELAGLPVPDRHDGRSLVPLLRDPQAEWREDVMTEWHGHRFLYSQRALRWKQYKYVWNPADTDELYDLADDPCELANRIGDPELGDVLRECRRRLLAWIEDTDDGILRAAGLMLSD